MRTAIEEKRCRGTQLFPFQHYRMENRTGNLFVPYHWHSEIEIIYVLEGEVSLLLNGTEHLIKAGDIYFINCEALHQLSSADQSLCYYAYVFPLESLYFRLDDYSQTMSIVPLERKKKFPVCLPREAVCYQQVRAEIEEIIKINENAVEGYQLQTKAALYKIIALLQRYNLFTDAVLQKTDKICGSKSENIRTLLLFLQENYRHKLYLKDVADVLHISPKYFCTYFKDTFGKSFVDYLNHFRIEKACLLLLTTDIPVMDIGFEVGFDNLSYFIKKFKSIMNTTPNQYRRRGKKSGGQ